MTTSLFSMYRIIAHSQNIEETDEDIFIAAKQVSQYVLGTRFIEVSGTYTYIDFEEKTMTFSIDSNRLVKTPGFEILLTEIENVLFYEENGFIYMNVKRDDNEYCFLINKAREVKDENTEEIE